MSVEYTFKRQEGFDLRLTGKVVAWVDLGVDPEMLLILYLAAGGGTTYVLVQVPSDQIDAQKIALNTFYPDDNVIKKTTTLKPQKMFVFTSENDLREKLLELVGGQLSVAKKLLNEAEIDTFNRIGALKLRYVAEVSKHDKDGNIQEFKMYEALPRPRPKEEILAEWGDMAAQVLEGKVEERGGAKRKSRLAAVPIRQP